MGQTFAVPSTCTTVASVTFAFSPLGGGSETFAVTALLYKFDLATDRVIGPLLGSQTVSISEAATILTVTFANPIQLPETTTYAIILTSSGLGQTNIQATVYPSLTLTPRTIPDGTYIRLNNGDDSSAIATSGFQRIDANWQIVIA